jgi:predicted nucleic acid-binding Zn ribbon protein
MDMDCYDDFWNDKPCSICGGRLPKENFFCSVKCYEEFRKKKELEEKKG